jgi:hypothetical protein
MTLKVIQNYDEYKMEILYVNVNVKLNYSEI